MAPHSSTLAWKIPWAEEPGRLPSIGSWRVGHDWAPQPVTGAPGMSAVLGLPLSCPCRPHPHLDMSGLPHLETPCAGNHMLLPAPGRRPQQACSSTPAGQAGTPAPDQRLHSCVPRHGFYRAAILDPFHRFHSPFPPAIFQVHCSEPIIPPFKNLLWLPHHPPDSQTP